MRSLALLSLVLLAACAAAPSDVLDPNLYDANGHVIPPVVAAQPPQPDCREVWVTVTIAGKPQEAVTTACRQHDGSWRLAN